MSSSFNKNNGGKRPRFNITWMYAIILALLLCIYFYNGNGSGSNEMSYTEFCALGEKGGFKSIEVYTNTQEAQATLTDAMAKSMTKNTPAMATGQLQKKVRTTVPSTDKLDDKVAQWKQSGVFRGNVTYTKASDYSSLLWSFGPIVLLIIFWFFFMGRMSGNGSGGGVFNVGKSKAKLFDRDNSDKVTFKDVAGLAEPKQEVAEIVDFLKNPQRYTNLGGKIPKGALLVGPPGTGKTLLAKAVAGEANVPFFSMSGSDFVEMFVGVGASRVRDLFRQAKEKAPCIVFIDEIDAVGRARGKNPNMGSNDERENTLNQLLTEMDGFGTNSGVIVLAATNRADILDKALLRAGRFDRQIYVDLPEINDRKEIFNVHLRKVKLDGSVDLELLARQTPGFSGADIANVCNEAALIAARRNKKAVQRQDFNDAVDRIIGGLEKRSKVMTEEERRSIAVHEAGHATVSWHLKYADPIIKVTIVPRGKALGAAWYLPEERQIVPKQALLDKICSLLAGRVAEEKVLGYISTGALNDLERATKMAYAIVTYYGMSDKLPNLSYYDSSGQAYGFTKPYSDENAKVIDAAVQAIIDEQYKRAREILDQYADGHHDLAELLLSREVIYTEDAENIFGKRPWKSRTEEIMKQDGKDNSKEGDDRNNTDSDADSDKTNAEANATGNKADTAETGNSGNEAETPDQTATTPPSFNK